MKKIGSLMLTTVLACGMAMPVLAAEDAANMVATGNNASTVQGNTMHRTNNLGVGTNGGAAGGTVNGTGLGTNNMRGTGMNGTGTGAWNRNGAAANQTGRGMTGYGTTMNNTTRAYADGDGMDWGWLGLVGLLGLAGMRGRERTRE